MLQQYGTPDELYNRPANRFVASFVGSVLINFLPRATTDGAARVIGGEGALDVATAGGAVEGRARPGTA